jgi:deoxycytidylate deaminase
LIHHKLFRGGKVIYKKCLNCDVEFGILPCHNKKIYCSNSCKHKHQEIWNRGLKAEDSEIIARSRDRMLTSDNPSARSSGKSAVEASLVEVFLPHLAKKVKYSKHSNTEKEWLLQVDSLPGVKDVDSCGFSIDYVDHHGKARKYYPDFYVHFETGLSWVVEVKGIYTEADLFKISAVTEWCEEHGLAFRIITTGMVHRNTWFHTYAHTKEHVTPSKELVFMNHAVTWACLSASPKLKVGCVITDTSMQQILAFGYNGDERGGPNLPLSYESGHDGFLHAEDNAIAKLSTKEPAVMFLTDSPCQICAKRIVNTGCINEVYYLRGYRDTAGVGILLKAGIKVMKFEVIDQKGTAYSDQYAFDFLKPGGF